MSTHTGASPDGDSEGSLSLFLRGFAARDLAESLASFDEETPATTVLSSLDSQQLEFAGIRAGGAIAAWIARDDYGRDVASLRLRSFHEAKVLTDTASLNEVIEALEASRVVFVRSFGAINGIIHRGDAQKPAMRMWLFGLVTITELRVTRLIDECCPSGGWERYLSEGRLRKAHEIQEMRLRRGQRPSLLDCLQFADKGRIVARDDRLRELTRFASKREVDDFVASLQALRDNLAHSQDIMGDWEAIRELATNLNRIVLGPPHGSGQ